MFSSQRACEIMRVPPQPRGQHVDRSARPARPLMNASAPDRKKTGIGVVTGQAVFLFAEAKAGNGALKFEFGVSLRVDSQAESCESIVDEIKLLQRLLALSGVEQLLGQQEFDGQFPGRFGFRGQLFAIVIDKDSTGEWLGPRRPSQIIPQFGQRLDHSSRARRLDEWNDRLCARCACGRSWRSRRQFAAVQAGKYRTQHQRQCQKRWPEQERPARRRG